MDLSNSGHDTRSCPRRKHWSLALAALAASLAVAPASGPAAASQAAPPPAVPSPAVSMGWLDIVIAILERLYQILGGDPNNIPAELYPAMSMVTGQYNTYGCPNNLTEEVKAEGRADIEWLWDQTYPGESTPTVGNFRTMLRNLYANLGGNPDDL